MKLPQNILKVHLFRHAEISTTHKNRPQKNRSSIGEQQ